VEGMFKKIETQHLKNIYFSYVLHESRPTARIQGTQVQGLIHALRIDSMNVRLALVCKVKDYIHDLKGKQLESMKTRIRGNILVKTILLFKKYGIYKEKV
jgi:hypothetical protein